MEIKELLAQADLSLGAFSLLHHCEIVLGYSENEFSYENNNFFFLVSDPDKRELFLDILERFLVANKFTVPQCDTEAEILQFSCDWECKDELPILMLNVIEELQRYFKISDNKHFWDWLSSLESKFWDRNAVQFLFHIPGRTDLFLSRNVTEQLALGSSKLEFVVLD